MIKNPLNPINFIECEGVLKGYIDRINKYLVYDGYEVFLKKELNKDLSVDQITDLASSMDDCSENNRKVIESYLYNELSIEIYKTKTGIKIKTEKLDTLSHNFIKEQINKCDKKISCHDYDGAITNARSLIESLQEEIIRKNESIRQTV